MNYKVAICDDSDADRQYIYGLTDRWAQKAGHTLQISLFSSAENFLFHYEGENDFDILLLDRSFFILKIRFVIENNVNLRLHLFRLPP